jgi:hypothetical protein
MWIVAWVVPYNSSVEKFDSFNLAKETFDKYSKNVGSGEKLYICERWIKK